MGVRAGLEESAFALASALAFVVAGYQKDDHFSGSFDD